jgi:N-acyl amino acid synthase of PEP-CTERM/exosortase system
MNDIADFAWHYAEYFDVVRADSPELLAQVYRLRYQVYCLEHPFENPEEHDDGLERDEDDYRSVHSLLVHRHTGTYAGTVRAILPEDVQRHPLPIHRILAAQNGDLLNRFPSDSTAEISRFAVFKEFRRRRGEERYVDANVPGKAPTVPSERQMIPYITFGLIRGVVETCAEHGISHISAVMEPPLIRILGRFGIHISCSGASSIFPLLWLIISLRSRRISVRSLKISVGISLL